MAVQSVSSPELYCSAGSGPLIEAVSLFPCNHKVNQAVAEKWYGMDGNSCALKGKECVVPDCNTLVKGWAPDPTIRSLASRAFGHEKARPLALEEKKAENLAYPGIPAEFVWKEGDWNQVEDVYGANVCRQIHYMSITENSLLKEFSFFGYPNGAVFLTVVFSENSFFKEYLQAHQLFRGCYASVGNRYMAISPENVRKLFDIVANNNEIQVVPLYSYYQIYEIMAQCAPAHSL
jgi:hypothetical protein